MEELECASEHSNIPSGKQRYARMGAIWPDARLYQPRCRQERLGKSRTLQYHQSRLGDIVVRAQRKPSDLLTECADYVQSVTFDHAGRTLRLCSLTFNERKVVKEQFIRRRSKELLTRGAGGDRPRSFMKNRTYLEFQTPDRGMRPSLHAATASSTVSWSPSAKLGRRCPPLRIRRQDGTVGVSPSSCRMARSRPA